MFFAPDKTPYNGNKLNKFSFEAGEPSFRFDAFEFSFRIHTNENVYFPGRDALPLYGHNSTKFSCRELLFAGGQKKQKGEFEAEIRGGEKDFEIGFKVAMEQTVKAVSVVMRNLDIDAVISNWDDVGGQDEPLLKKLEDTEEWACSYPSGENNSFFLPVFILHARRKYEYLSIWNDDLRPSRKRLAVCRKWNGIPEAVLVYQPERCMASKEVSLTWRFHWDRDMNYGMEKRLELLEKDAGLKKWGARDDVPSWLRETGLVVNLHCVHWSGFVFNTFEQHMDIVRRIFRYVNAKNILFLLLGWDGRFGFSYPEFEAASECGGESGLKKLIDFIHENGGRVIPSCCGSLVSAPDFPEWKKVFHRTREGITMNSCNHDLDSDFGPDHFNVYCDFAHKAFFEHIRERTFDLLGRFYFDGIYFRLNPVMMQDYARHDQYAALKNYIETVRKGFPEAVICGESSFDLMMPLLPLFNSPWQGGKIWRKYLYKYCRCFEHLSYPAPGKGSTGVYMTGYEKVVDYKYRKFLIPTFSVVDDTVNQLSHCLPEIAKQVNDYLRLKV